MFAICDLSSNMGLVRDGDKSDELMKGLGIVRNQRFLFKKTKDPEGDFLGQFISLWPLSDHHQCSWDTGS